MITAQPAQEDLQGQCLKNVYIRTDRLAVVINFVESFTKRSLEEMEIIKNKYKENSANEKKGFLTL